MAGALSYGEVILRLLDKRAAVFAPTVSVAGWTVVPDKVEERVIGSPLARPQGTSWPAARRVTVVLGKFSRKVASGWTKVPASEKPPADPRALCEVAVKIPELTVVNPR